jgi:Domain of unknown function (DUF4062)
LEKRYQVFVSSTYADLKEERHKVFQTLMELDCIPAGMELFPATDEDQFEFIKKIIDDCDYYLLIIGGRYGSLTEQEISYTEQEYKYALDRDLKVIALLHQDPNKLTFEKSEPDPDLRSRLQAFRDTASTGRLVKFWNNAEELPGIVALSLSKTIKMHPAIGWVRADKISNEELLFEINELRKQNAELSKTLSEIEPSIFTGREEKDFSFIFNSFDRYEEIELTITPAPRFISTTYKNENENEETVKEKYSVKLASLIPFISSSERHEYYWNFIGDTIAEQIYGDEFADKHISVSTLEQFKDDLFTYGLIEKNFIPSRATGTFALLDHGKHILVFSEKLERYKYWLKVNGKLPDQIEINKIE